MKGKEIAEPRLSDDGSTTFKRTNTYKIKEEEKSSILTLMKKQEQEQENKFYRDQEEEVLDKNSSEDDEEYIRKSMISNQQRFSLTNMNYFDSGKLTETKEEELNHKHMLTIWSEEKANGLAGLWDELISLNDLVIDKNDRIFTNFDCLLFYFEVSDIIKLQKWSRSLWRIFNPEQMKRLVRIGNLDEDLRARFWISQMPFFSFQNQVREKIGMTDLFSNAYEWILKKIRSDEPLDSKIINEIGNINLYSCIHIY